MISLGFFLVSAFFWVLHYQGITPKTPITWVAWLIGLSLYFYSLKGAPIKSKPKKSTLYLLLFVTLIYFTAHLWNYSIAPWNTDGLFDDAAWDLVFAKNYVFNNTPFQPVFYDPLCVLFRETFFHYFTFLAFKGFGFNLGVFNLSLILAGFFGIIFIALLAQEFFSHFIISILVVLMAIFLPVIFIHSHAGYRYAMTLPLMMISYYFLSSGFRLTSERRIFWGGVFAGFCLECSITGKQYLLALLLASGLWFFTHRKLIYEKAALTKVFVLSLIFTIEPLIFYIIFTGPAYFFRESSLTHTFIVNFLAHGLSGIRENFQTFCDLFFTPFTYTRWFEPDFLIIPLGYYPLLIVGSMVCFVKQRYIIPFISLVVLIAAFTSTTNDYRILLATGPWVLAMGFALDEAFKIVLQRGSGLKRISAAALFLSFLWGLVPSVHYLYSLSSNTFGVFYFPHKDVALSRFLQDVVVGASNPSTALKPDEFNRADQTNASTDFLICPETANAILRLYIHDFDSSRILYFCGGIPYNFLDPQTILGKNLEAVRNHREDQDLQLIWELSNKIEPIVKIFRPFEKYGHGEIFTGEVSGKQFKLYSLFIKKENLRGFKNQVGRSL